MPRSAPHQIIPPHGGYAGLRCYLLAQIVHDGTVAFCRKRLPRSSRTVEQMVQAARSGKQNIVEGSRVSGTSKKLELKLIGVARASLEELLEDYKDFLRQTELELWAKDHPKAVFIRGLHRKAAQQHKSTDRTHPTDQTDLTDAIDQTDPSDPSDPTDSINLAGPTHLTDPSDPSEMSDLCRTSDPFDAPSSESYALYKPYIEQKSPETAANTLICLIHQANFLLDQLLKRLEIDFTQEGGITERLHAARTGRRCYSRDD